VRPSCHCTIVNFDTLVMPGKTSVISAAVGLSEYHSGTISKPVTVTSDAVNIPVKQLEIHATIFPVIDVSERFVDLYGSKPGTVHSIVLSCRKKDLKVTGVEFRQNAGQESPWKEQVPMSINFSWVPLDSVLATGYRAFRLNLVTPSVSDEFRGVLVIRTNHPAKQEVIVQCILNK
jgi:hypothetical protein